MKNQFLSLLELSKGALLFSALIALGGCKKENYANSSIAINRSEIGVDIGRQKSNLLRIPKILFDLDNDWHYKVKIIDDGSAPITHLRITCEKIGETDLCSEQDIPFRGGISTGFIYNGSLNFSDSHPSCGDGVYKIKILARNKAGKAEIKKVFSVSL